ncbi:hypothetical protein [Saccharibacillus qingshengii]|uniref:hypothetical protein n=1 Tax=Saccharibacillus qingshengii TaxID=1763540 RepID=UPI001557EA36|nr:hypothetical protein [Saccharibacillus qingshengii]
MPSTLPPCWIEICAGCGRTRHNGAWRDPEPGECPDSVRTHDICPDCIRTLYPGYVRVAERLRREARSAPSVSNENEQTP